MKNIAKLVLYIVFALIIIRLFSSTLKLAAILAVILCSVYFVFKKKG